MLDYIFRRFLSLFLTTLTILKIKNGINKLYKKGLIEVIVHNNDKINVKILYLNIFNILNFNNTQFNKIKNKRTNSLKTKKIFKKPEIQELKNYFLELSDIDESETMFDYYESNGWKVGKTPMKCWKSATRNWIRRAQKNTGFPDYYDSKLESQISNSPTQLTKYHSHLKKLGWKSIYSPSAGTTWKKPKI